MKKLILPILFIFPFFATAADYCQATNIILAGANHYNPNKNKNACKNANYSNKKTLIKQLNKLAKNQNAINTICTESESKSCSTDDPLSLKNELVGFKNIISLNEKDYPSACAYMSSETTNQVIFYLTPYQKKYCQTDL